MDDMASAGTTAAKATRRIGLHDHGRRMSLGLRNRTLWRSWTPDLVIEVVSESSRDRDYTEKRDEYWSLGVMEYWIVDAGL
jgi:hypothetical protein